MSSTLTTLTPQTVSNRRAESLGSEAAAYTCANSNETVASFTSVECFADVNPTMPVATLVQKWTISHLPVTGLEFGLTKTYRQRPKSLPPG